MQTEVGFLRLLWGGGGLWCRLRRLVWKPSAPRKAITTSGVIGSVSAAKAYGLYQTLNLYPQDPRRPRPQTNLGLGVGRAILKP